MLGEGRCVAALGNLDLNGIVPTGAEVVALQATAELARLHPHHRIGLRIEAAVAAEHLEGDRVSLQTVRAAGERLLDHEAQKGPEPIGCDELLAREDPLQFLSNRLRRRLAIPLARIAGLRTRHQAASLKGRGVNLP